MTKSIKLTDKQIEALYAAIRIHSGSYDGWSDAELSEFDVKRELLALRQVEAKLDEISLIIGDLVGVAK
jgi:hypothetical protein